VAPRRISDRAAAITGRGERVSEYIGDVVIEGPSRRQRGQFPSIHLVGNLWRVPFGLRCPYCEQSPELTYRRHGGILCSSCDRCFTPVGFWDTDELIVCSVCEQEMARDGPIIFCRSGNLPTHSATSYVIADAGYAEACHDCAALIDIAGTGRLCRSCVFASYVETWFDQTAARWLACTSEEKWLNAVGFPREISVWGRSDIRTGFLVDTLPKFVPGGWLAKPYSYDPDHYSYVEQYAVEMQSPYKAGQLLCAGVPGSPDAGLIVLYRLCEATGLIYEAALPAGNVAAPDSELGQTPRGFSRKRPYPDRIIGAQHFSDKEVRAFQQAARGWVINEVSKRGRPEGITTFSEEEWQAAYGIALADLRRDNIRPTPVLLAMRMGISERTFYRYRRGFGEPPD
jgi:hypothetical protein